jgi:hypothetical protein
MNKKNQFKINTDILAYTLCALFVLHEHFESKEVEWQLIAKKARTGLKNQGFTEVDQIFNFIKTNV